MKLFFLLTMLLSSTGMADSYTGMARDLYDLSSGDPIEPGSGVRVRAVDKQYDEISDSKEIRLAQKRICPSGWKKSDYLLSKDVGHTPYHPDYSLPNEGNEIVLISIEICPDNGLLRVKP